MIDQLEHFLVEYLVSVISVAVTKFKDAYFFNLFCAFNIKKGYILISVNCNEEFWHLSPD